jgi:hypothetical protein
MAMTPVRRPGRHLNLRCFNPQFFIASRVGDVALDRDSDQFRAGNVDARMRTVVEALRVICRTVPTDGLSPADRLALDRVDALGQHDAPLTSEDVDDLIQRLRCLRREDPESADQILRRLVEEAGTPAPTR